MDKSSFWCQVTSVLFPDEGGELGYTTLEDITARKNLELVTKAAQYNLIADCGRLSGPDKSAATSSAGLKAGELNSSFAGLTGSQYF